MKTRMLLALAGLTAGLITPAFSQTTAKDLVGTWTLVSITLEKDGTKTDMYGPNPQGQTTLDANGHFSAIIIRSDLPKFASNNREAGTPDENKAILQGSIAFFGTYSVDVTADKTIVTQHVESCTFPNWNGTDRKLSSEISGDEVSQTAMSTASTGTGIAHLVWKRAK